MIIIANNPLKSLVIPTALITDDMGVKPFYNGVKLTEW